MKMAVVDACFSGAWVLPDESSKEAERVLRAALNGQIALVAPDLWHYEICNLLTTACRRGRIEEDRALEALALLHDIPIHYYDHRDPLPRKRVVLLAARFKLSAYDASYLELADRLQCSLCTLDEKLREASRQITPSWESP